MHPDKEPTAFNASASGRQRPRAKKACRECNLRRVRCDVMECQPCHHCQSAGVSCELMNSRRGKLVYSCCSLKFIRSIAWQIRKALEPVTAGVSDANCACCGSESSKQFTVKCTTTQPDMFSTEYGDYKDRAIRTAICGATGERRCKRHAHA